MKTVGCDITLHLIYLSGQKKVVKTIGCDITLHLIYLSGQSSCFLVKANKFWWYLSNCRKGLIEFGRCESEMWFTVYLFYFYCNFNNSWLWYEFGCHVGRWSCLVEIKEKKPIKYWLHPFKHAFVRWFGCWHLRIDLQQGTALQIVIFWVLLWYGRRCWKNAWLSERLENNGMSWIGLAKNSRLKLSRNRLAWAARLYCIWTDRNASLHNGNLRSEAKAFYLQKSQKLNLKQKFYTYSGRSLLLFLTLISFEVVVLVYLVVC